MNLAILQNNQTMSSREIAELTKKDHSHVLRDIRVMLAELYHSDNPEMDGIDGKAVFNAGIEIEKRKDNGQIATIHLPKREALILTSGYSITQRARIIDRWQELESQQQFKIPTTLSGALKLAYEQAEQIEAQQLLLEQQKPAVEFVERYVEARSSKCLSDVAKILKWKPREFIQTLADKGVLFKRGGAWIPHQCHIDAGRFTVTTGEGNGHAYSQTRVEPDGIVWLAKNFKRI